MSTPSHKSPDLSEYGVLATREQLFEEDVDTRTVFRLHPFGVTCYVVIQQSKRLNAMTDTAERCLYLFAGVYNPFSHAYANSPQSSVVLRENRRLMITNRNVFPYLKYGLHSDKDQLSPRASDVSAAANPFTGERESTEGDNTYGGVSPANPEDDDDDAPARPIVNSDATNAWRLRVQSVAANLRGAPSHAILPAPASTSNASSKSQVSTNRPYGTKIPIVTDPTEPGRLPEIPTTFRVPAKQPIGPGRSRAWATLASPSSMTSDEPNRSTITVPLTRAALPADTRASSISSALPPVVQPVSASPAPARPPPEPPPSDSGLRRSTREGKGQLATGAKVGVTHAGGGLKHAQPTLSHTSTSSRREDDVPRRVTFSDSASAPSPVPYPPTTSAVAGGELGAAADSMPADATVIPQHISSLFTSSHVANDFGIPDAKPNATDLRPDLHHLLLQPQSKDDSHFRSYSDMRPKSVDETYRFHSLLTRALVDEHIPTCSYSTDTIPESKRDLLRDQMAQSFARDLHLTHAEWSFVTQYISNHHDQVRTPNPDRPDSHGFSRGHHNYGATHDMDDSAYDSLFMQYVEGNGEQEIWLYAQNEFTLKIEKHKLLDLKTVPVEQHPAMLAAIAKEFNDLIAIGTFADLEIPVGRKAIPSRIVLKVKYRADGEFDKFKARHVVKGFMQQLGYDYFSTFSPMATMTAVRCLFAIAVQAGVKILHADVPQAFLKAFLKEDIWARLPPGISFIDKNGKELTVVKLIRALYGLKQSPAAFNKELLRFLKQPELKFKQLSADTCLYYHINPDNKKWCIVASEVDDLLITGTDDEHVAKLLRILKEQYAVEKHEDLSSFLGININYSGGVLAMDVRQKIVDVFKRHAILEVCKKDGGADVPIDEKVMDIPDLDISKFSAVDRYFTEHYASINGSLIYMAITCRPDITFAIGKTSRGMHNPRARHVAMLRKLIAYLWKTRDYKLHYYRDGSNIRSLFTDLQEQDKAISIFAASDGQNVNPVAPALVGLADANFANVRDEELKSISGFVLFVLYCAVSWRSKMQTITAESTHEAELIAVALAANEMVWIRRLLTELGFALGKAAIARNELDPTDPETLKHHLPVLEEQDDDEYESEGGDYVIPTSVLGNDNMGTTQTVNNPETKPRNRFVGTKHFKTRKYIMWARLAVNYIPTAKNVSDMFTKALVYGPFAKFRTYVGVTL